MGNEGADILVVDDNPNNLGLMVALLKGNGFHPRPAINGAIALNAAFGRPPDLVLLDVRMSGMDGYEVCRQLKADERTRDIPVLFLSALESVEDKVKGFEAGGVDYITKPFDEREVLTRVRAHLALAESSRLAAAQSASEERLRMGRELHDSVTQTISSLLLYARGWQQRAGEAQKEEVLQWLQQLNEIATQALKELRLLLYQIDPSQMDIIDLKSAVQNRLASVEERVGIKTGLEIAEHLEFNSETCHELFSIITEALNNALKHARASSVRVSLQSTGEQVRLEIADDGSGFILSDAQSGGGLGLKTMDERARQLGGIFTIDSQPGKGTRVRVDVPMEDHHDRQD